jgi:hypothetical protein
VLPFTSCCPNFPTTIIKLFSFVYSTPEVCEQHNDAAMTSLIANWIDEAKRRAWFVRQTICLQTQTEGLAGGVSVRVLASVGLTAHKKPVVTTSFIEGQVRCSSESRDGQADCNPALHCRTQDKAEFISAELNMTSNTNRI